MDSELRDRPTCHPSDAPSTANPRDRGRAAAALISVCLGFFVIQLDSWSAAVNVGLHHAPDQLRHAPSSLHEAGQRQLSRAFGSLCCDLLG